MKMYLKSFFRGVTIGVSTNLFTLIFLIFGFCLSGVLEEPPVVGVVFQDESPLVVWVEPTLPEVIIAPAVSIEKLLSEARIQRMRIRRAAAKEFVKLNSGVERPTAFEGNPSNFGGSKDNGVKYNEPGSISGKRLRAENPEDLYIAWFMPSMSEDNPNSPIKVPSIERLLGGESNSLKKQVELANKKMPDYLVEICTLDHTGRILEGPVYAKPIDRGPNTRFENARVDTSRGVCKELNIEASLRDPNSDECKVTFVVRLVHKDKIQGPDNGDLMTKYYGYHGDPVMELASSAGEIQTSSSAGYGTFQLPSWDWSEKDNKITIASNP